MTRLDDLRVLESAATPGPWRVRRDVTTETESGIIVSAEAVVVADDDVGSSMAANAEFMAAFRNAAPEMLDVLEKAAAWWSAWSADGYCMPGELVEELGVAVVAFLAGGESR